MTPSVTCSGASLGQSGACAQAERAFRSAMYEHVAKLRSIGRLREVLVESPAWVRARTSGFALPVTAAMWSGGFPHGAEARVRPGNH